ncbi:hypothetical protein PY093_18520 [Cytobacillus sp. S13-E01]|uniref:hypothetical protein n=1 Tax=Cytobacillus sp. S13-E01 TaxID=3031326 RepID=UPI0023D7D6B2|nr:hypothetical protein [Cytobacillus sp. S13-E01]MDF0728634.1 hypothetical protein [Cytobacillus sp. S13-E01]
MILFIIILLAIIGFIYQRYFPVWGVQCTNSINHNTGLINILDVRDYNETYKDPIQVAINIPLGYLRRYYGEIDSHRIHVVAANHLEKNISIRFLRRKGFKVMSYTLTDCECKHEIKKKLSCRKENSYGI